MRDEFGIDAVVHFGKHGNLEWLPGKALALESACIPEAVLGPVPHLYPFIVNDPGEGAQAKRRTAAVIIDHLTPPMTQADSHGIMAELASQDGRTPISASAWAMSSPPVRMFEVPHADSTTARGQLP